MSIRTRIAKQFGYTKNSRMWSIMRLKLIDIKNCWIFRCIEICRTFIGPEELALL